MQTTESESRKNKLLSDEESINFRPSPNFKHMKKYLKSKFEESGNVFTPNGNNVMQEKINENSGDIQPPLPPNPPPPDSPLTLNLKQEIEDDDYNELTSSTSEMSVQASQELAKNYQTGPAEAGKGKQGEEIMCRNFIRGSCTRGASCIFAHKIILSQLNGVYRFCNDFQNSICNRRKCRFVHASVFEKEYFLRTAYLPPHTLSHLKDNNVLQPPPPPPPITEGSGVGPTDVASSLNNQPPLPILGSVTPVPMMSCTPAPSAEPRNTVGEILRAAASDSAALKREWSEMEDFSSSPREFDCNESKKCKNCDINEIRLQLIKNKTVKLKRSDEELNKKIFITCKKSNKLMAVLATLVKSMNSKNPGSNRCLLTVSAEKEKVLQEQIPLLLSDNRMPLFREESNKVLTTAGREVSSIMPSSLQVMLEVCSRESQGANFNALNTGNVTFQSILTKLLLSSRDQSLSPDGS